MMNKKEKIYISLIIIIFILSFVFYFIGIRPKGSKLKLEDKTKEISDKDQKYQNKIKILETEHSALQTEYESVQSAMNKNIERSFKVFS